MDYEKMYKELKEQHDTMVTTFDSFKTESQREKEEFEKKLGEKDSVLGEKDDKINELQQTNMSLYLRIPQGQEQAKPKESKSMDQILKEIEGVM